MLTRALVVLAMLGIAGAYASTTVSTEAPVSRESLANLPMTLGPWHGRPAEPFPDDVVAQLGVDEYVHRSYVRAGSPPVAVYIGYYASQRQGDTIHSPQNCLPGAGWQPVDSGRQEITVENSTVAVNRYLIARGLDRQVVLYWYQGRNRVVANEYANKALLMLDAARIHRTNGGLVRLIAPAADDSTRELSAFAAQLLPHLGRYLP